MTTVTKPNRELIEAGLAQLYSWGKLDQEAKEAGCLGTHLGLSSHRRLLRQAADEFLGLPEGHPLRVELGSKYTPDGINQYLEALKIE